MAEPLFWKGRRVLLTGATGFIGSALVDRLLALGADVSAVIRTTDYSRPYFFGPASKIQGVRVITGDIRDFQTVQRAVVQTEPALIFHLAAITQVVEAKGMPLETYQTNVLGTVNVLEAARQATALCDLNTPSVIVASSDKAYGRPLAKPVLESTPFNPFHPYDASKAAADIAALSYSRHYDMPITIARMANVFGPGDTNWRRLVPGTIRSIMLGEPVVLRSDGKAVRDYLYIDDAVEAYLLLAQSLQSITDSGWRMKGSAWGRAFNFPGLSFKVLDVVALIALSMGYKSIKPVVLDQADDETQVLELSTLDSFDVVGNYLTTNMADGIARTVEWMRRAYGSRYQSKVVAE